MNLKRPPRLIDINKQRPIRELQSKAHLANVNANC